MLPPCIRSPPCGRRARLHCGRTDPSPGRGRAPPSARAPATSAARPGSSDRTRRNRTDTRSARRWGTQSSRGDRKSTRLNSSHLVISYAVFCLKKKNRKENRSANSFTMAPPCPTSRVLLKTLLRTRADPLLRRDDIYLHLHTFQQRVINFISSL